MPQTIVCPACQTSCSVPEKAAGRRLRCPQCGQVITVPVPVGGPPGEPCASAPASGGAESAEAEGEAGESGKEWKGEEAELDMTPMVDVTFQLLIFFMVTAAFAMQKSIEVPKPKQDAPSTTVVVSQDPEQDPSFVTFYVDENNTYRVVTVDWDTEAPSEQELLRKMREAKNGDSAGHVPTKLLVKAHGDSLHEKVVAALDAGTEVGMEEIQLMTVEDIE
jgi:biopolymer transport protein ExbD